jgi:putative ATPase
MNNLFSFDQNKTDKGPLPDRVRPNDFSGIIGQDHLLNEGAILRRRIDSGNIGAIVLYGPAGIGKTTIARAVGKRTNKEFIALNAAHNKTSDIEKIAKMAQDKKLLVFIDEIQRYNATTSDLLLDYTEAGLFDLIGATSENPNFALTKALVSRMTIYELKPLCADDMKTVVKNAITKIPNTSYSIEDDALSTIAAKSGGDARRALNALESCIVGRDHDYAITLTDVNEAFQFSAAAYDKSGDQHYDIISAFIKSMRGSDPDATLYWLARLIQGGEDPRFIARRIFIHAAEDVGLADPTALQSGAAAMLAADKIGYPEVRIILAEAALHVCLSPKSNASYQGIDKALDYVQKSEMIPVPMHLRDTHYAGAEGLGRKGYLYPHAYPNNWIDQDYAPGINTGDFFEFKAKAENSFESKARAYWEKIKAFF